METINQDLVQLSVVVGVFFPLVAALVKQSGLSSRANAVIATVLAAVAGVVTAAVNGQVTLDTWGTSSVAIFIAAVAAFAGFWKPTGVDEAIKNATSVKKA